MSQAPTLCHYHQLRVAQERFQCNLNALDQEQRARVEREARTTQALERRVLASEEARAIVIPAASVDAALATLRARYPDADAFEEDLALNGLDEAELRQALHRELRFDAVLQRIAARAPGVDEAEILAFYHANPERFRRPEQRQARHLLITINTDYAENRRDAARARIERLAIELAGDPERFEQLAQRHSECPSALEGGLLGMISPGQLFPALDAALFALPEGGVSGVLESEVGFHLLRCERIEAGQEVTLEQARERIRALLTSRSQRRFQKAWIDSLEQDAS